MLLGGGNLVVHSGFSVGSSTAPTNQVTKDARTEPVMKPFMVKAYPNPTEHYFILNVQSASNENIEVKVFDVSGKQVYVTRGSANQDYRFGDKFVTGVYIVEVRQGNQSKTLKLIKQ